MDNYGSVSRSDDGDDASSADAAAGPGNPPQVSSVPGPDPVESGRPIAAASTEHEANLAGPLAIYSVLRVALIAALTAVLAIFMPLIVALIFAIVIQLPLAWILFAGPRRKVNDAMAQKSARRRAERQRLQSALSGDEPLP